MATPIAAGAVTLIRQYFTEGFYPSGGKQPADAFLPSGALLKAVLLGKLTCCIWTALSVRYRGHQINVCLPSQGHVTQALSSLPEHAGGSSCFCCSRHAQSTCMAV